MRSLSVFMSEEEKEPIENSNGEAVQPKSDVRAREEETAQLRHQLESKEQENKGLQDKYLRLYAEFENYKKRVARDQEEYTQYANERLFKELLPIVDNLERAIFHSKEVKEPSKILEGLELILKQCLEAMGKFGVSPFDSHLQPFDPSRHQAIGQVESEEYGEGTVIEEVQKGYRFNDRILRPALVIVSKRVGKEKISDAEDVPGETQ